MTADLVIEHAETWRVERRGEVVVFVLWRRAELSREQGAQQVRHAMPVLVRLLDDPRCKALIVDLRAGPSTWGPITHKALVDVLAAWDVARRPSAVISADEAIMRFGVAALVNEGAPRAGQAVVSFDDALAYVSAT